ncbi:hypothetical protein C8J57DRAFT_1573790 [Mycena rebaudengoi]|nr:hypothetical protein C8J57DRAFT_1573790 [Mycena rebaudengoi]
MSNSSTTTAPTTPFGDYSKTVSPQLIGALLVFFLFGFLTDQIYVYRLFFHKDRLALKLMGEYSAHFISQHRTFFGAVYFVYVSVLVCTCLKAADIHFWFARSFGDISGFSDPRLSPVYIPLWGLIIALTVHLFFCYRIFLVGRRRLWPLVAVIALISCAHCADGMACGISAYAYGDRLESPPAFIIPIADMWLIGGTVADVMIAATMTAVLLQRSTDPSTRKMVKSVVVLIVETNSFSAIVAVIALTLYKTMPNRTYYFGANVILPAMCIALTSDNHLQSSVNSDDIFPSYANTLLATLNNRAIIQSNAVDMAISMLTTDHKSKPLPTDFASCRDHLGPAEATLSAEVSPDRLGDTKSNVSQVITNLGFS